MTPEDAEFGDVKVVTSHEGDADTDAADSLFDERSRLYRWGVKSWTQVFLVSICCLCLPGTYNANAGIGGSGQLDPTVSAVQCSYAKTRLGWGQCLGSIVIRWSSDWSTCRPACV